MATTAKRWLARESALVRFRDDPALLHWRTVLVCLEGDRCSVATPDRDINDTNLEVGDVFSEVIRLDGERLPRRVRERDTYLPRHSGAGDFGVDEVRSLVPQAEAMAGRIAQADARRRVSGKMGQDGKIYAAGLGDGSGDGPQPREPVFETAWMVVYDSKSAEVGDERQPALDNGSEVMLKGDRYFLWHEDGRVLLARSVRKSRLAALGDLARQGVDSGAASERDVRTLPVIFDVAEEMANHHGGIARAGGS